MKVILLEKEWNRGYFSHNTITSKMIAYGKNGIKAELTITQDGGTEDIVGSAKDMDIEIIFKTINTTTLS